MGSTAEHQVGGGSGQYGRTSSGWGEWAVQQNIKWVGGVGSTAEHQVGGGSGQYGRTSSGWG